jgi:hypothetical protein
MLDHERVRVHVLGHERVDLHCVLANVTQLIVKLPPLFPIHNHVTHVVCAERKRTASNESHHMWTTRTRSRPSALIHHNTAHMHRSTAQHITASLHSIAPRGVVGMAQNMHVDNARFSLAGSRLCVSPCTSRLTACTTKPNHALLPWTRAEHRL